MFSRRPRAKVRVDGRTLRIHFSLSYHAQEVYAYLKDSITIRGITIDEAEGSKSTPYGEDLDDDDADQAVYELVEKVMEQAGIKEGEYQVIDIKHD